MNDLKFPSVGETASVPYVDLRKISGRCNRFDFGVKPTPTEGRLRQRVRQ